MIPTINKISPTLGSAIRGEHGSVRRRGKMNCPLCGGPVRVVDGDPWDSNQGKTFHYESLITERLKDAEVVIRLGGGAWDLSQQFWGSEDDELLDKLADANQAYDAALTTYRQKYGEV
jgi:hypothetical protein